MNKKVLIGLGVLAVAGVGLYMWKRRKDGESTESKSNAIGSLGSISSVDLNTSTVNKQNCDDKTKIWCRKTIDGKISEGCFCNAPKPASTTTTTVSGFNGCRGNCNCQSCPFKNECPFYVTISKNPFLNAAGSTSCCPIAVRNCNCLTQNKNITQPKYSNAFGLNKSFRNNLGGGIVNIADPKKMCCKDGKAWCTGSDVIRCPEVKVNEPKPLGGIS
jgi:hypothetical protein